MKQFFSSNSPQTVLLPHLYQQYHNVKDFFSQKQHFTLICGKQEILFTFVFVSKSFASKHNFCKVYPYTKGNACIGNAFIWGSESTFFDAKLALDINEGKHGPKLVIHSASQQQFKKNKDCIIRVNIWYDSNLMQYRNKLKARLLLMP